jgi:hypothetical protein
LWHFCNCDSLQCPAHPPWCIRRISTSNYLPNVVFLHCCIDPLSVRTGSISDGAFSTSSMRMNGNLNSNCHNQRSSSLPVLELRVLNMILQRRLKSAIWIPF